MITDIRADTELDPQSVQAIRGNIFIRILPVSAMKNGLAIVARKEAWESQHPLKAEVVSVGGDVELPVKKGDIILIKPDSGKWIGEANGADSVSYRMIEADEALALVEHV